MPHIAILHIPDHTPGGALSPDELYQYLTADLQYSGARVIGLYEFPSKSDPACTGCSSTKINGWGRSPRGWMRCSTCGHRSRNVRKWFVGSLFDWFGANLLGEKAPGMFRTPSEYGLRDDN